MDLQSYTCRKIMLGSIISLLFDSCRRKFLQLHEFCSELSETIPLSLLAHSQIIPAVESKVKVLYEMKRAFFKIVNMCFCAAMKRLMAVRRNVMRKWQMNYNSDHRYRYISISMISISMIIT
jgi:hypothetical protein